MVALNILTTKGLTKNYGGIRANTDIDFELQRGKVTALIGPNGAGKSTFVGMLCGRFPATRGEVFFEGRNISSLPAHKRIQLGIAYTFQITSVYSGLTLLENVAIAARRRLGKDVAAVAEKVNSVLAQVGLSDRAHQIAGDLSYGHQRVLEIAMGLAQDPRLFILDEPTKGLAETEIDDFVKLIRSLAGETTILLIEHNMDVVMRTADQITVLEFGKTLASGTPDEIHRNEAVQAAYLGTATDA